MGIVHVLEPVEVNEEDGGAPTDALRLCQHLLDSVEEERPIGKSGEGIVGCLLNERFLSDLQVRQPLGLNGTQTGYLPVLGFLGAEVGEGQAAQVFVVDHQQGTTHQYGDIDAVIVAESQLDCRAQPVRSLTVPERSEAGGHESGERRADNRFSRTRQQSCQPLIRIEDGPALRDGGRPIAHVLDEHPIRPIGCRQ